MKKANRQRQPSNFASLFLISIAIFAIGLVFRSGVPSVSEQQLYTAASPTTTLESILGQSGIEKQDILSVNLACAINLPGSGDLDDQKAQATLDSWVKRVKVETAKYLPRFQADPASFNNSEAYFRVLTMVTVLQQDCGVRYNPAHTGALESNDSFFSDASDVFLTGILCPKHRGTCSSMPVLYVAVGRKLGYPLKLVTTKGHLFCRWEDSKERFNIEATNEGLNCFPDDYYKHWPFELSPSGIASGRYLRSLTPKEELALFLQTRGMCLKAVGRFAEAREAWERAKQLAPDWEEHEMLIARVSRR